MWLWLFFFKQKTAYEMRISDWSSDVCSSDLSGLEVGGSKHRPAASRHPTTGHGRGTDETCWRPAVRGRKAPSLSRGLGHQGVRQGAARGEPCARREIERRQLCRRDLGDAARPVRSEEHTSELQSLMRIS